MALSDLGGVVFILTMFAIIHTLLALSLGISEVKNNWQKYKCNPAIIPLAPIFGQDINSTFDECIKGTQVDFMQTFLEPIYKSLGFFSQTGLKFISIFENIKMFGNQQHSSGTSMMSNIYTRMNLIGNEISYMYINIQNTFSKLASTVSILFYILKTGRNLADAADQELPGTLIGFAS